MAPRVPSPDQLGIGNVGAAQADTPFQNFSVPDFSASSKLLIKAGSDIQSTGKQLGAAIETARKENEKRTLLEYEADVGALNNEMLLNPQTGLANKQGQAALNAINGTNEGLGFDGSEDDVEGIADIYAGRLAEIRARHGAGASSQMEETLDLAGVMATNKFTAHTNKKQIEEQKKVDDALVSARVARAAENAALAVGQPSPVLANAITISLNQAKSSVTDPDIGSGRSLVGQPELVAELVKQQQGIVAKRVIDTLIATGDTAKANELLSQALTGGTPTKDEPLKGILVGTKEGIGLQSSLLSLQQAQKFADKFQVLRTDMKDKAVDLYNHVTAVKDVKERAGLMKELTTFLSARNAVTREEESIASTAVLVHILKNKSLAGVNPEHLATVVKNNPALMMPWVLGDRFISNNHKRGRQGDAAAYERTGGSPEGSNNITEHYKTMAETKPEQFLQLMKQSTGVKALVNFEQFQELRSKRAEVKGKLLDIKTGKQFPLNAFLMKVGFGKSNLKKKRDALMTDLTLRNDINDKREEIFKQTGQAATEEDLRGVIAQHLVSVEFETGGKTLWWKNTAVDLYTLSKAEEDNVAVGTLEVGTGDRNLRLIAMYFGVSKDKVQDAVDRNDSEQTIDNIGKLLGTKPVQAPSLVKAFAAETEYDSLAVEAGYPPGLIKFIADTKKLAYNDKTVPRIIKSLSGSQRNKYPAIMIQYLESKGQ